MIRYWQKRWLLPRITRNDVLDRLARHTLVHPTRHGARVPLPDLEQQVLFDASTARIHHKLSYFLLPFPLGGCGSFSPSTSL